MILSPVSADKLAKIRVKNREPVPSYRMDRNDDELDAIMVSDSFFFLIWIFFFFNWRKPLWLATRDVKLPWWWNIFLFNFHGNAEGPSISVMNETFFFFFW